MLLARRKKKEAFSATLLAALVREKKKVSYGYLVLIKVRTVSSAIASSIFYYVCVTKKQTSDRASPGLAGLALALRKIKIKIKFHHYLLLIYLLR